MDNNVKGSRTGGCLEMKCTECKSAQWDYEEYYGTTQKEYFVCGCKEDKDPEMCENEDYEGMCGSCHYWHEEEKGHSCMCLDSIFAADWTDADDSCNKYVPKRKMI